MAAAADDDHVVLALAARGCATRACQFSWWESALRASEKIE